MSSWGCLLNFYIPEEEPASPVFLYHKYCCYKLNILQYKINETYVIIKLTTSTMTEPYTSFKKCTNE